MKEIKKKELKNVTITHISYVRRGANRKVFFLAKSDKGNNPDIEFNVKLIEKAENDEHLLYGVVYEPGTPDTSDAHDDYMKAEEIQKMAHEFLEFYRNVDKEHDMRAGVGVVVESYIAPIDMSIGNAVIKSGSWVLVTRPSNEMWDLFKSGEITGYSMYGIAREVVGKGENKVKWYEKILETLGIKKTFDETMQETLDKMVSSPSFIMDILQEDFFKSVSWESSSVEMLTALSKSMGECKAYIDNKVLELSAVSKSEEEPEKDDSEPESQPEEPEVPEEPVIKSESKPEQNIETEEDTKPEPESEPSDVDNIQKSIEEYSDKFNESISKIETMFNDAVKKMSDQVSELNDRIDKNLINSSAVLTIKNSGRQEDDIPGKGLI